MQTPRLSHRAFGLVFAGVFAVFALVYWLWTRRLAPAPLAAAGALAAVALVRPALLWPLNRLWSGVVQPVLARVVNGVVLSVMFFVVLTPFALLRRLLGRSPIALRPDPARASYLEPVPRQTTAETLLDPF